MDRIALGSHWAVVGIGYSGYSSAPPLDKQLRGRGSRMRLGVKILLVVPLVLGSPVFSRNVQANFPPFAAISVDNTEGFVDEGFRFSSAGSVDPDAQPEQLSYSWDFGDGAQSSEANPRHIFINPGAYNVAVVVSDGADQSVASVTVVVLDNPTPTSTVNSSPISFNQSESELWVVNPDSDSVSVFSVTAGALSKIAELPTGRSPRTVSTDRFQNKIYVTCQEANELWVFQSDPPRLERTVQVGHLPYGVAASPSDGKVIVSNQGDGTIHVLNSNLFVEAVLSVPATPRAVAINADGTRAYVTHFLTTGNSGLVTEIDLSRNIVGAAISLVEDPGPDTPSSSRGFPNLLSAISIEPAGRALWVGGYKSNSGRGLTRSGDDLSPFNTIRGFLGRINLESNQEEMSRRIDPNNADSISSIAFSPNGRFAFVTHQGAETVSIYDVALSELIKPGDGNTVPFLARVDVGAAPQGLVLSEDGCFLYVASYLSRNVTVLNVSDPARPSVAQTVATTVEPLPAAIANGKRLFYSSKAPRHSRDNYIACASCHSDGGGMDGRTWDFTGKGEGLRNTIVLRGRKGIAHGPLHWSGNFDEVQDFENDIVYSFGGLGLAGDGKPPNPPLGAKNAGRSQDLDDLAAYVNSLSKAQRSPFRLRDGTLSPAGLRGKALFARADLGCIACHNPPRFTDSFLSEDSAKYLFHDVGTLQDSSGKRLGQPLAGIDTPSLLGLWASAPYLHDGSAPNLYEVLLARNSEEKHGRAAILTPDQINDLVIYLLSLDDPTSPDLRVDADEDGLSDSWEMLHDFDPGNRLDGKADPDLDGLSNFDEFLAGTNPNEPFSALRLFVKPLKPSGDRIWFQTVRGIRYAVESSAVLYGEEWQVIGTIEGDGTIRFVPQSELAMNRFYRLRVLPTE